MNLVILILITSVGVAKAAVQLTLNKSSTPCTVYAKDADLSNKNDGILYNGSLEETVNKKKVKVDYGICCPKSYRKSQTNFRSSSSRAVCCQQGKGSICYSKDGYRACPGFVCLAYGVGSNIEATTAKDIPYYFTCPDAVSLRKEGRIHQPDLIVYKDKVDCKDRIKKYQIVTIKRGQKSPPAYRWCCSEDITSNFTAKPRDVCCGLAGSQPPNRLVRMATNVDTPPCCRKLQNKNNCDPESLEQKSFDGYQTTYRICRATSGGPQTPKLSENMPAFSVLQYLLTEYKQGFVPDADTKKLYACDSKGNKLMYAIYRELSVAVNPVVCCPKNIFYSDAETMSEQCCITFVSFFLAHEKNIFECSRITSGFVRNDKMYYLPCDPKACKKIPTARTVGILSNQSIFTPFNVSDTIAQPLYGVYNWNKNKYLG